MTYNFDPDSDEAKGLPLLANIIEPIKAERISQNFVRWTFGVTVSASGDEELIYGMAIDDRSLAIPRAVYPTKILTVDQSYNTEKTLEEPSE